MKIFDSITMVMTVAVGCFLAALPVQSLSAQTVLKTGGVVGCGGQLSSTVHHLTGSLQLTPGGVVSGGIYRVSGGIIGAAAANVITVDPLGSAQLLTNPAAPAMEVTVDYTGGIEGAQGTLYYRYGGQAGYMSAPMEAVGDSSFRYLITPELFGIRGLEYYGEVQSIDQPAYTAGDPSNPRPIIVSLNNAQGQRPAAIRLPAKQYRIIGVPLDAISRPNNSVRAVFEDDLGTQNSTSWRLARYESVSDTVVEYHDTQSGVRPVDDPALGYWLITRGGENYGAQGRSMRPNVDLNGVLYYEAGFTLDNGWNQLANPLPFGISWQDVKFKIGNIVQADHSSAVEDFAYQYDGVKYVTPGIIPAWGGMFVRAIVDNVKILFPYQEAGVSKSPVPPDSKEFAVSSDQWFVTLSLSVEGEVTSELTLGVRPDASEGADRYDYASPPPPPGAARMTLYLPDGDPLPRRCDYRSVLGDGAVWELTMTRAVDKSLMISGLDNVPGNMEVWLLPERGEAVSLTEDGPFELGNDVTTARLVIGTQEYSSKEVKALLPREFALEQNFPNPFNPSTNLSLALPSRGKVRLELYNLLGQRVRTLVDGPLEAGYHTLVWDGTDQSGRRVASGIYFYRMTTANFTQSRKMLLLK